MSGARVRREERKHTLFKPPELDTVFVTGTLQLNRVATALVSHLNSAPIIPFEQDALKRQALSFGFFPGRDGNRFSSTSSTFCTSWASIQRRCRC